MLSWLMFRTFYAHVFDGSLSEFWHCVKKHEALQICTMLSRLNKLIQSLIFFVRVDVVTIVAPSATMAFVNCCFAVHECLIDVIIKAQFGVPMDNIN